MTLSHEPRGRRYRILEATIRGASFLILGLAAWACGGSNGSQQEFSNVTTIGGSAITPQVISSDLSVGTERLSVGLLQNNAPVKNADVQFNVYKLTGDQGTLISQVKATDIHIAQSSTERHADGSVDTHEAGSIGVYVANINFDAPGDWGLVLTGKVDGKDLGGLQVRFRVQPEEIGVAIGEPAPQSVQPLLKDVANLEEVDTSPTPDPLMHSMTVAEAVASGKPTLIAFATPSFCRSAVCGPVKLLVDDLFKTYGSQVNFVHIEPYDLPKARAGQLEPIPLLENEWRLETEPWVFIVGKDGRVTAKFEAAASQEELETALKAAINTTSRSIP